MRRMSFFDECIFTHEDRGRMMMMMLTIMMMTMMISDKLFLLSLPRLFLRLNE